MLKIPFFFRFLVAMVLFLAGFLKLVYSPLPGDLFFGWRHIATLLAEVEIILGVWLLFGLWTKQLWWTTFIMFVGMSIANLFVIVSNVQSCGCFGDLRVNPIWILLLDLSVLGYLIRCKAKAHELDRKFFGVAISCSSAAFVFGFVLLFGFNYLNQGLAAPVVSANHLVSEVGAIENGEVRVVPFRLFNHSESNVQVVGISQGCGCRPVDSFPVLIPPKGHVDIDISVRIFGVPARDYVGAIWFFLDSPEQFRVAGSYRARIRG